MRISRLFRAVGRMLTGIVPLLLLAAPIGVHAQTSLKVMTFNVRLPLASDGANSWDNRREFAAQVIARAAPDVIGTQELHKVQGDDLVARLPQYAWFGIDRRGGHADEHMGVFYRRDRLKILDSGNFWLSDTPEVPGSISWGHPYPRMVTWAQFETIRGRRRFYLFNTHLPYRAEDGAARAKGAALLLARIDAIAGKSPVVLTGDFNTTPDTDVHALLTGELRDAWVTARRRVGPAETFHNFTGVADRRIDWILTRGFVARRATTLTDHRGPLQSSDHFPVVAELGWRRARERRVEEKPGGNAVNRPFAPAACIDSRLPVHGQHRECSGRSRLWGKSHNGLPWQTLPS
ncbi:endonuclease/exonuclease/phosphatase family protein [Sphingomonas sp. G-3-2-10]|nr:endonuclease/exonuclease/phosphatase family protein [Sphingomonas sp. G-3-2-10]